MGHWRAAVCFKKKVVYIQISLVKALFFYSVFYRYFFLISLEVGFVPSLSKACHSPVKNCSIYSVDRSIYQGITRSCSMKVNSTLGVIPTPLLSMYTQKKSNERENKYITHSLHTLLPL